MCGVACRGIGLNDVMKILFITQSFCPKEFWINDQARGLRRTVSYLTPWLTARPASPSLPEGRKPWLRSFADLANDVMRCVAWVKECGSVLRPDSTVGRMPVPFLQCVRVCLLNID